MTASISTVPRYHFRGNPIGGFIARTTRGTSLKSKGDKFSAYTHTGRDQVGPSLTDAAPEIAPGELFV